MQYMRTVILCVCKTTVSIHLKYNTSMLSLLLIPTCALYEQTRKKERKKETFVVRLTYTPIFPFVSLWRLSYVLRSKEISGVHTLEMFFFSNTPSSLICASASFGKPTQEVPTSFYFFYHRHAHIERERDSFLTPV